MEPRMRAPPLQYRGAAARSRVHGHSRGRSFCLAAGGTEVHTHARVYARILRPGAPAFTKTSCQHCFCPSGGDATRRRAIHAQRHLGPDASESTRFDRRFRACPDGAVDIVRSLPGRRSACWGGEALVPPPQAVMAAVRLLAFDALFLYTLLPTPIHDDCQAASLRPAQLTRPTMQAVLITPPRKSPSHRATFRYSGIIIISIVTHPPRPSPCLQ